MANIVNMTLSEELNWRGFINQTTLKDIKELDNNQYVFYFGVDPSADSMQIGNLAMAMMVKHFINHGHKAFLLVGGATGQIGDPDGKAEERNLKDREVINANKQAIAKQFDRLFKDKKYTLVDNNDWFKDIRYLDFLRNVGKHIPMRQMLSREFVESRLGSDGAGISYAEFSYVLIQAYDFLYLNQKYGVNLQLCGSDQWGNSIAGVDLIRRVANKRADVWSGPLIINLDTGVKFGKSENGAIWLDSNKTSPTDFYQFWVNVGDKSVEHYLKIYTELKKADIDNIMKLHKLEPKQRKAQFVLADNVTAIVHGKEAASKANSLTKFITGELAIAEATEKELKILRENLAYTKTSPNGSIIKALLDSGLAESNNSARQLLKDKAVYINQKQVTSDTFKSENFQNNRLILRRGKAYKDSALIEISH